MPQYVVTGKLEIYWAGRATTEAAYEYTVDAGDEKTAIEAAERSAADEADEPFFSESWEQDDWQTVGRPTVTLLDDPEAQARYEARQAYKAMRAARVPTLFELAAAG